MELLIFTTSFLTTLSVRIGVAGVNVQINGLNDLVLKSLIELNRN